MTLLEEARHIDFRGRLVVNDWIISEICGRMCRLRQSGDGEVESLDTERTAEVSIMRLRLVESLNDALSLL